MENTDYDWADKTWKTPILTGQTKRGKHQSDWTDKSHHMENTDSDWPNKVEVRERPNKMEVREA